jgi:hypothetical protein
VAGERGPYRTKYSLQSQDFKGSGKLRCEMCGEPFVTHLTMEFCKGKTLAKRRKLK